MRLNRENFLAALLALEAAGAAACTRDDAAKDETRVLGAQPGNNPAAEGFGVPPVREGGVPPTREGGVPITPVREVGAPPVVGGLPGGVPF
ncbi:MAG TPA: hypothetical protein VFS00_25240, partial [Polyangiaceae bacterium]|nr:hypothetical protein [Polyangiaceae bacterium]